MATTKKKKTAKKTTRIASKKTTRKTVAQPDLPSVDQMQQVVEEAFRRGVRQARNDTDQFVLTLNEAPAFSVLERMRAEWVRVDIASIDDTLRPLQFVVYQDKAKEYRWRALAANGEIVADSGEGYSSLAGATRARDQIVALIKAL